MVPTRLHPGCQETQSDAQLESGFGSLLSDNEHAYLYRELVARDCGVADLCPATV